MKRLLEKSVALFAAVGMVGSFSWVGVVAAQEEPDEDEEPLELSLAFRYRYEDVRLSMLSTA